MPAVRVCLLEHVDLKIPFVLIYIFRIVNQPHLW